MTVLFCDLVGSTAIAERLDPEDWRDTVVRFQQQVIGVIEQAGGHVAQHLGDGLLVYFGYPHASEDDAERALRCGLALIQATRALNPELESLYQVELSLRVGLHTGPVVVGEVGGRRRETLALGSTANVAARVQGAAAPDTVVATSATLGRVASLFMTEDLGEHSLKGIEHPVRLYAVKRPSGRYDHFEHSNHGLTPLIGRAEELALLESSFAEADQRHARAAIISGEAGIGKSRLVQAFRQRIAERGAVWHECRAAAYNRNSPLQPWLQLQRELMGIGDAAPNEAKLRQLEIASRSAGLEPLEAVPLLAALHALPLAAPYMLPQLSPLGLRKRTLALMADWLLGLAREQVVVLLIEDLHWLDPSSLELLDLVMGKLQDARLLLLLTHRPDFDPPWGPSPQLTNLALQRLDAGELRTLVNEASPEAALSDDMVEAIITRSDGIPLFAEELTWAAVPVPGRAAAVTHAPPIPDTLEQSLMARLEQAGPVKEIAQLASVLGLEFPLSLLEGLWQGEADALHAGLRVAERARVLLRIKTEAGGSHYSFAHGLIRDAAYHSLLRKTRRRHHLEVAQVLREHFGQTVREQPELLAHHLTEAKENDAAIEAWQRAGALALGRAAYEEAIRHLRQARALLAERPGDARALDVEQVLACALVVARGWAHDETRQAWEAAAGLCDSARDPLRAGAIACGLGDVYSSVDLEKSLVHFEALVEAGRRNDLPLLAIAGHQGAAIPLRYLGRYAEARRHLDAGLAIYDPKRHRFIESGFHEEKGINLLCWSAWLHWDVGALDKARKDAARAIELAEAFANPFAMALAGSWGAIIETWSCNWPRAIELGARAANLAAEQGFAALESMGRFAELPGRGIAEGMTEAAPLFAAAIGRLASTGNRLGGAEVLAVLANLLLGQGQYEQTLATVETALGLSAAMQQPWCDAWLLTLKARALLARQPQDVNAGGHEEAEELLRRALLLARAQGARFYELRAATALARLLHERAADAEGAALLRLAIAGFDVSLESVELDEARQLVALFR